MINYYEVVVNTARVIGNYKATKSEIEKLAKRMFGYAGKVFDETAFAKAYHEFRLSDRKINHVIYA